MIKKRKAQLSITLYLFIKIDLRLQPLDHLPDFILGFA
jgi:hypothetical protein